ncbi:hypothetical protein B0H14DRAFT_3502690 [Mycena olivaceomarginata]|nr:hypothetical protein B0H14DRAFT_3502690 [Mycena olivaceomarginata]
MSAPPTLLVLLAPDSPTLVPRYDFSYYEFERKEKAPSFKPHAFWIALSSAAGRLLAKLSVVCRNPKHEIDDKMADDIVNQALPSFRLAASTQYLTVDNPAVSSEWEFFPFPPSEIIPAYPLGKSPPRAATTADSPTKDQINNAPHLSKIAHPTKPASDKHKSKPQLPKSPAVINDESSEDEEPPTKRTRTSVGGKGAEPSTSSMSGRLRSSNKSETAVPKPKKGLGSVDEQVESMIPEIREKMREMMVEKKSRVSVSAVFALPLQPNLPYSGYIRHNATRNTLTLTLSAFQGHRMYIPNNTFLPALLPKEKGELPKEPLVELVRFSAIEYEQVLHPPSACLLCLMYGITCNPTVFGLACMHCNQKKMHTLCDHTWHTDKIHGILFPDAPIVANIIPHLIDQVSTARELYSSLRNDLTDVLHAFFSSVRNYIAVSGEEVFQQEFKSTLPHATARSQINSLIHAFNHYHDPKTVHLPLKPYELSDDEKDNARPSKSPRKVTLKVKEAAEEEKEDGEMDEDAEGEVDTTVKREPESSKSSPRKKRKRTPSE